MGSFDYLCDYGIGDYVLTNELYDCEDDQKIYAQVKNMAEKRKSIFIPVKLVISPEEHMKRITNPQRRERYKTTNADGAHSHRETIYIDHPNLLELDVTKLSEKEAAEAILSFVKNSEKSE